MVIFLIRFNTYLSRRNYLAYLKLSCQTTLISFKLYSYYYYALKFTGSVVIKGNKHNPPDGATYRTI